MENANIRRNDVNAPAAGPGKGRRHDVALGVSHEADQLTAPRTGLGKVGVAKHEPVELAEQGQENLNDQKLLKTLMERRNSGAMQGWCTVSDLMVASRLPMSAVLPCLRRIHLSHELEFIAGLGIVNNRYRLIQTDAAPELRDQASGPTTTATAHNAQKTQSPAVKIDARSKRAPIAFRDAIHIGTQALAQSVQSLPGFGGQLSGHETDGKRTKAAKKR